MTAIEFNTTLYREPSFNLPVDPLTRAFGNHPQKDQLLKYVNDLLIDHLSVVLKWQRGGLISPNEVTGWENTIGHQGLVASACHVMGIEAKLHSPDIHLLEHLGFIHEWRKKIEKLSISNGANHWIQNCVWIDDNGLRLQKYLDAESAAPGLLAATGNDFSGIGSSLSFDILRLADWLGGYVPEYGSDDLMHWEERLQLLQGRLPDLTTAQGKPDYPAASQAAADLDRDIFTKMTGLTQEVAMDRGLPHRTIDIVRNGLGLA